MSRSEGLDNHLSFCVTDEVLEVLEERCLVKEMSMSDVIRECINESINKEEK